MNARLESDICWVGRVRVDPTRNKLRCGQDELNVEPKVMAVLCQLLQRPGQVLTRDELINGVWGTAFPTDEGLTRNISTLRRLLRRADDTQEYIETIPKRGYRLTQPVSAGDVSGLAQTAKEPDSAVTRSLTRPAVSDTQPDSKTDTTETSVIPTLAVLAFDNLSNDPELGYLSDGVSEEILMSVSKGVSKATDINVIGRTSSFQYRGSAKTAVNIRQSLGATHVLDGSVRRVGDQVRIVAELVECSTEIICWSDRFDGSMADVFNLQDQIAAAVADALNIAFAPSKPDNQISPAAYQQYLLAHDAFSKSNLPAALDHAQRSLTIEKNNPLADTLLAQVFFTWATYGVTPHRDPLVHSRKHLKNAQRVQPNYAPAKKVEAELALMMERDYGKALELLRESTTRRMNVDASLPLLLVYGFRYDDAITLLRRIVEHDPLNLMHLVRLQRILRFVGRREEADEIHRQCLEVTDSHALVLQDRIEIAVQSNNHKAARAGLDSWLKFARRKLKWWPVTVTELWLGSRVEMSAGNAAKAGSMADALAKRSDALPTLKVEAYLNANRMDEAFHWCDEAVDRYDPGAYQITCPFPTRNLADPFFQEFRADPRFAGLLTRLGIDEESLATISWFDVSDVLL